MVPLFPSGDTTGVTDTANFNAAVAALPAGGTILLAPGEFYSTGVTVPAETVGVGANTAGSAVNVQGSGSATIWFHVGAGTAFSYHRTDNYSAQFGQPADNTTGFIRDFVIDGTSATSGAIGLDVGDGWGYDIRMTIVNFTATDCIAANLINRVFWTEKGCFRLHLLNNAIAARIDTVVSDISHEYNLFEFFVFCAAGQQGVECAGGVYMGGCDIRLLGNMSSGTAATQGAFAFSATSASPCVFTATGSALANGTPVLLSGTVPAGFTAGVIYYVVNTSSATFNLAAVRGGAAIASTSAGSGTATTAFAALTIAGNNSGNYSSIYRSDLHITVEGNPGNGDGTILPEAIVLGLNCLIHVCSGRIGHSLGSYSGNTVASILNGGEFTFAGPISGDPVLAQAFPGPPGSNSTIATQPAFPGLGTIQQNYGPNMQVAIAGGTVTGVTIDGIATGLTSGMFFVPAGGTISVSGTVAPTTYKWIPACWSKI